MKSRCKIQGITQLKHKTTVERRSIGLMPMKQQRFSLWIDQNQLDFHLNNLNRVRCISKVVETL